MKMRRLHLWKRFFFLFIFFIIHELNLIHNIIRKFIFNLLKISGGGHNTGARYNNLEGKCIHDLVHPSDSTKLADHFQAVTDAASSGAITGPPTRIRFPPSDPYLSTRPQSRIFLADPTTNDKDFIISTFTMLT